MKKYLAMSTLDAMYVITAKDYQEAVDRVKKLFTKNDPKRELFVDEEDNCTMVRYLDDEDESLEVRIFDLQKLPAPKSLQDLRS